MLIKFENVPHYVPAKEKDKPLKTTDLYLNPAYIVSIAQDVRATENGHDICYLTMASRGDPEEGNDYYKVVGLAPDLKNDVNLYCIAVRSDA